MKFIIVIAGYNVVPYIGQTLASIRSQTRSDWTCIFCDDCSTDGTADVARQAAGGDLRIRIITNTEKKYLLRNLAEAIASAHADPDDVVVTIDGDDWLAHPNVLERVAGCYEQGAWMTYGSYAGSANQTRGKECSAYPAWVTYFRLFRWTAWRASHLKTFKVWLWQRIDPHDLTITEAQMRALCRRKHWLGKLGSRRRLSQVNHRDLVDPSGMYFRRCIDKVTMFPMLEMAGTHAHFIPEVLYVYNQHAGTSPAGGEAQRLVPRYSNRFIRHYLKSKSRYHAIAK
jgi:glycosyltransferase involved in cell wall biosynthesis